MAFCTNCGDKLDDGTRFCSKCGTKIETDGADIPAQPVYQQSPGQFNAPPPPPQQQQAAYQAPPQAGYQQGAYQQQPSTGKNPWQYFCDVLKKYVVFQGRARRAEYWGFFLFNSIFSIVLTFIDFKAGLMITENTGILSTLYALAVLCPGLGVLFRRMHDCDKAMPYFFIPVYGLVLLFTNGTNGPNRFGPDPKQTNN